MRKKIWLLISPEDGGLSWFNWMIIALVIVSLMLLAIETEPELSSHAGLAIMIANRVILAVFAIEYVGRLWAAGADPEWAGWRGRLRYVRRPSLLTDLLAFLPEILLLIFFPAAAQRAMILRFFRLVRLFRLFSFFPPFRRMGRALLSVAPQLGGAAGVALGTIFFSACLLYLAEGETQPDDFGSIPRALWWAVATLTTVGYGDAVPETVLGKVAAGLTAITGVGVVALPAGILAGAFAEEFKRTDAPPPSRHASDR